MLVRIILVISVNSKFNADVDWARFASHGVLECCQHFLGILKGIRERYQPPPLADDIAQDFFRRLVLVYKVNEVFNTAQWYASH